MKNDAWPTFSLTQALEPPEGWRTDCAVLSTYSADLIVIVTTLLALSGCDLDHRRTGSRVELVKALEALHDKVRVLAQAGRVAIPNPPRPILKLLDRFLTTVDADEAIASWHPKIAMIRYYSLEDPKNLHWRIWIGSCNLTRSHNWESGLVLISRSDGKGQAIEGLSDTAQALAARAKLPMLPARRLGAEFSKLTWDCPTGSTVHRISFLGPERAGGFPEPAANIDRMFIVSPFLDRATVEAARKWGNKKTKRTLVSTAMELSRLYNENNTVFEDFDSKTQPFPDLPVECVELRSDEETTQDSASDTRSESEEPEPLGLHAKLYFAAKGARRQLWIGSANATQRGWQGRNHEVVAELSIGRDAADALEEFVATCDSFDPKTQPPEIDADEEAVESARKLLSGQWQLRQRIAEGECVISGSSPPPITDPAIQLEVTSLGGQWVLWPHALNRIDLPTGRSWQRSDFVQVRVSRGDRMCSWLHVAPCDPPADDVRDTALIAEYLDPHIFLAWLRSLLTEEPARSTGGDWDAENPTVAILTPNSSQIVELGLMPTVEEILRAWVRDQESFLAADEKVRKYLDELERRAKETGGTANLELLQAFRRNWNSLASELR